MFYHFFNRKKNKLRTKTERPGVRPGVEVLEARLTPSQVLVVGPTLSKTAQFTSIQAAIDAAHAGDTIEVNSGTYVGQLTIGAGLNNLTLIASNGNGNQGLCNLGSGFGLTPAQVTIQAPAVLTGHDAIIDVSYSQNVTIQGFTINGNANTQFGIRVDDGANAVIEQNDVTNILAPNSAAILVGRTFPGDVTTGTALIENNTVSSYAKSGIVVDSAGSYAVICNNTVTGLGPQTTILNYGIQISRGGIANVENNNVSGNDNTGNSGVESAGILLLYGLLAPSTSCGSNDNCGGCQPCNDQCVPSSCFSLPTSTIVQNNNCFSNEDGIFLQETKNVQVICNNSYNNADDGITVVDTNNSVIDNNTMRSNGRNGVGVYGGDPYQDTDGVNTFTVPTGGHNQIVGNTVSKSGSDGFFIDYQFTTNLNGVLAQNTIAQDQSNNNAGNGFNFEAADSNLVWQCTADNNQMDGFLFQAGLNYNNVNCGSDDNLVLQDQAQQNTDNGFAFTAASNNNLVIANQALHNDVDGFYQTTGSSNTYQANQASGNGSDNFSSGIVNNPSNNWYSLVVAWGKANGFNTAQL